MSAAIPEYIAAADLADMELEGLPATKRGVNKRARTENWEFRDRPGKGGGRLYKFTDLPTSARADYLGRRKAANRNIRDRGRPRGSGYFAEHPEFANAVEAVIADRKLSAPRVLELLQCDFDTLPSLRSLQRYIAQLERRKCAAFASMRNPDQYKGKYRLALGSADGGVTAAHEVWELDTTKADVLTIGGRIMVLGLIDRWSRRARFLVVPSESAQSVRSLLIDTIRAWGVMPDAVATDNGSGFINASVKSALETLGIEQLICPPGSPEKKPFVERLFGTFTRERAELLGGYAGHSVAEAQQLRARARKLHGRAIVVPEMTNAELQGVLDAWTDGVYHLRAHSSLRMSPMAKWQQSPRPARAAPGEAVLKMALSALVGTRRVGKRGIQWKGGRYWAAPLAAYAGRDVIVRRDEDDLGALFIFDEDGNYIDTAVNAERAGLSEERFARAARVHQDTFMKQARAELRDKQRGYSFEKARDQLLRQDAERAGKLAYLSGPTIPHSTDAMDSMADANPARIPSAPRIAGSAPAPRTAHRTPAQKMAEADAVMAAVARGEDVDETDLRKARAYAQSPEYQAEKITTGYFASLPDTPNPIRMTRRD